MDKRITAFNVAVTAAITLVGVGNHASAAQAGVSQHGAVTKYTSPGRQSPQGATIDFVNAKPMTLPRAFGASQQSAQDRLIQALMSPRHGGKPAFSPGRDGDGKESAVFLGTPVAAALADGEVTPQQHGTTGHPFTTVRADAFQGSTNKQFPFRASGKLFFNIGPDTFVCSASLIKRGIVVTAAHCVIEFGGSFYSNWVFVPGYKNGDAPYGTWSGVTAAVPTSYANGTDSCAVSGVVCQNDVAVIRLAPQAGKFPGAQTGFYGFGVNGFGFASGLTHVTQIGYPVCLDNGSRMERNDSYGYVDGALSSNTVIGSLMCGGSSGGPWLVNFGKPATRTGTTQGAAATPNTVVGVTSWGYVSTAPKEQGASPFTSGNIGVLAPFLCGGTPNPC
jgi:V8-like Glu-specific endopeptidase